MKKDRIAGKVAFLPFSWVTAALLSVFLFICCNHAFAGPPQGMLDQICSDEKTKQQLIVTWNTIDLKLVPYVEKYWNNQGELNRLNGQLGDAIQQDMDEWERQKIWLKINLLALQARAVTGGIAKATSDALKYLDAPGLMKKALKKVLEEIQNEGKMTSDDDKAIKGRLERISDLLDKIDDEKAQQEWVVESKKKIFEIDGIIKQTVVPELVIDLPSELRGKMNTPIPLQIKISGGCNPFSISITSNDPAAYSDSSMPPSDKTDVTENITLLKAGTFNVPVTVVDRLGKKKTSSVPARIWDPNEKADIKVQKTASAKRVKEGEKVTYKYTVTNTGNLQLTGVGVSDDKCQPLTCTKGDCATGTMNPGDTWELECTAALASATENIVTARGSATSYQNPNISVSSQARAKVTVGPCPEGQVQVPNLINTTMDEARDATKKVNLRIMVAGQQNSDNFREGAIMDQDRNAGECVDPDTVVGVTVSTGPKKKEPQEVTSAVFSVELDCGESFEIAAGDFLGKSCGIVVKGWKSNTSARVELKIEYDRKSRIEASPGDQSQTPDLMYTAGVSDTYDRYVFGETFRASDYAPQGTTTVAITVSQAGVGTITKLIRIAVLPKGQLPGSGAGIRPPATVAAGSGGEFCVWRYKIYGDPPPCFHFVAAKCGTYGPPRYELVGSNMTWGEADARIGQLSQYFDDQYGCNAAMYKPPPPCVYGYSRWTNCQKNGTRTRTVTSKTPEKCTETPGPILVEECVYVPTPCVYTYEWSECGSDSKQYATVTSKTPEDCEGEPVTERPCKYVPPPPVLTRFGVFCSPSQIDQNGSASCRATGEYSDAIGTYVDLTGRAAWSDGPTIDGKGRSEGSIAVTATVEGASDTATVTVTKSTSGGSGYDPTKDPGTGTKPPDVGGADQAGQTFQGTTPGGSKDPSSGTGQPGQTQPPGYTTPGQTFGGGPQTTDNTVQPPYYPPPYPPPPGPGDGRTTGTDWTGGVGQPGRDPRTPQPPPPPGTPPPAQPPSQPPAQPPTGGTTPPPATSTGIEVTVVGDAPPGKCRIVDGQLVPVAKWPVKIAGMTITLTGPVNSSTTSSGGGQFSFAEIPAGNYVVSVKQWNYGMTKANFVAPSGKAVKIVLKGSCPYLFVWTGEGYERENDIYSVARLTPQELMPKEAREMADTRGLLLSPVSLADIPSDLLRGRMYPDRYILKNHLRPDMSDRYLLRIKEQADEFSFTDHAGLLAIDHPAGTEAGLFSDGRVFLYTTTQEMRRWIAMPGDGAATYAGPAMLHDGEGIEMALPREAFDDGFLAVTWQGFQDGVGVSKSVASGRPGLSLQRMDAEGRWRSVETVYPRDEVDRGFFALDRKEDGWDASLKVRLVAASCLQDKYHRIDGVAWGAVLSDRPSVTELKLLSAVRNRADDVREELRTADGKYVLLNPGEEIDLAFDAVARTEGMKRTFVFLSEGVYIPFPFIQVAVQPAESGGEALRLP